MNKEVSYPLSKLLKEKGFNLKVVNFYDYERLSTPFDKQRQVDGLINYNPINWNSSKVHYTSAPTISDVVMWIYEKHGIWVYTYFLGMGYSCYVIQKIQKTNPTQPVVELVKDSITYDELFNSPIEAYEAAFKYTLNNLI